MDAAHIAALFTQLQLSSLTFFLHHSRDLFNQALYRIILQAGLQRTLIVHVMAEGQETRLRNQYTLY